MSKSLVKKHYRVPAQTKILIWSDSLLALQSTPASKPPLYKTKYKKYIHKKKEKNNTVTFAFRFCLFKRTMLHRSFIFCWPKKVFSSQHVAVMEGCMNCKLLSSDDVKLWLKMLAVLGWNQVFMGPKWGQRDCFNPYKSRVRDGL